MNEILVSVIMPVYNAEKYLKESIESILQQTYSNIELIIIDDGSKDNSIEIIKNYKDERVRSFYFANSGCSKQRNYGLYKASGDIIALMDADDISEKTRLENQIDFLKSNQDIKILGTNCLVVDENGKKMSKSWGNVIDPLSVIDNYSTDALRLAITLGNTPGNNLNFSLKTVEENSLFLNKFWNIIRFAWMNIGYITDSRENLIKTIQKNKSELLPYEVWILSRLSMIIEKVSE